MKQDSDKVALVDMDGTLCDYDGAMQKSLEELQAPCEENVVIGYGKDHPDYIWNRMKLIKSHGDWWENLPRLAIGFEALALMKDIGFYISILTQGPRQNPVAWSHKVAWCMKNVPDIDITITRNKGLSYGRVLMDDYPEYIRQWLEHRPRGLVIMPAQKWNTSEAIAEEEKRLEQEHGVPMPFPWGNIIRYDGTNIKEVHDALIKAFNREAGEDWREEYSK